MVSNMKPFLPKTRFSSNLILYPRITWQELKELLAHAISTHPCSLKQICYLHARTISSGLGNNLHLCSLLIRRYFSLRDIDSALKVFYSQWPRPMKTILWNTLIRGCLTNGQPRLALDIYHGMLECSTRCNLPDNQTFQLVISACTDLSEFELGSWIAGHAWGRGFESDLLVGTSLVDMYCRAGNLQNARDVFDRMTCRDVVSWNAMISGYSRLGFLFDAMSLFKMVKFEDKIAPNEVTIMSLVSVCGNLSLLEEGEAMHAQIMRTGFEHDLLVSNTLIDMYIKCHRLDFASKLFHVMVLRDAISWSTMIRGYVQYGHSDIAIRLFYGMVFNYGLLPTRPILINALLACADLGDWCLGNSIEKEYLNNGENRYESDARLCTALVYMHAKCGRMDISLKLLCEVFLVRKDVVAWNTVIKACAELGQACKASEIALQMQRLGIDPDPATFLMLLPLFSLAPSLRKGMELHAHILKRGFGSDRPISNALIDMYARSGIVEDSCKAFNEIQDKDVVSWSSMIKGCALNGNVDEALDLFQLMRETATRPNNVTFVAVLTACSYAGYVEKGKELFKCMKEEYGLQPALEHYASIVDLLCRAGLLSEVLGFLEDELPDSCSSAILWGALLSACRVHGNCSVGEIAARHLFYLEPENAANYRALADIYISAGLTEDANGVLSSLTAKGFEKHLGCSWLDGS